jgi:hypothetical protein
MGLAVSAEQVVTNLGLRGHIFIFEDIGNGTSRDR